MRELWRLYWNMWRASFGEMPHVGTFGARLFLILWHAGMCVTLIGLLRVFMR